MKKSYPCFFLGGGLLLAIPTLDIYIIGALCILSNRFRIPGHYLFVNSDFWLPLKLENFFPPPPWYEKRKQCLTPKYYTRFFIANPFWLFREEIFSKRLQKYLFSKFQFRSMNKKNRACPARPISFGGCLSVWAICLFFASFSIELNEVGID